MTALNTAFAGKLLDAILCGSGAPAQHSIDPRPPGQARWLVTFAARSAPRRQLSS